jgi:hypothetical protein
MANLEHPETLMNNPRFDQAFWEQLWSRTLSEHADKVTLRSPNLHLVAEAASLPRDALLTPAVDMAQMRFG